MHESTRNRPFWFNVLHGRLSHFSGFIRITHIFLYKTHWNLYLLPLNVLEFLQAKSETALYKKIKDTKKQRTMPSTQAYKWVCLGTHKTAYQFSGTERGVSTTWHHLPLVKLLPNHRPTPQRNAFKINYFHHCKYYYLAELGHILLHSVRAEKRGERTFYCLISWSLSSINSLKSYVKFPCPRQNITLSVTIILLFCFSTKSVFSPRSWVALIGAITLFSTLLNINHSSRHNIVQ